MRLIRDGFVNIYGLQAGRIDGDNGYGATSAITRFDEMSGHIGKGGGAESTDA